MIQTRGIALQTLKYSDSSTIAKFYTEELGLQSYILRGIRNKKGTVKVSTIQHMNLFNMVVTHSNKSSLHTIKELNNTPVYNTIPYDIRKSSIALFINELVLKSIKEEEPNVELFSFLYSSLVELDSIENHFSNFHLRFMIGLTKYLGFFPQGEYSDQNPYFNLTAGCFSNSAWEHKANLTPIETKKLSELINLPSEGDISLSSFERKNILNVLIQYYDHHVENFKKLKSHLILESIFQ